MLTEADLRTITETGLVPPDRVKALVFALRQQAHEARAAARAHKDGQKSHAAAALRGKARAYDEAAIMVQHIAAGHALHPAPVQRSGPPKPADGSYSTPSP